MAKVILTDENKMLPFIRHMQNIKTTQPCGEAFKILCIYKIIRKKKSVWKNSNQRKTTRILSEDQ